ncbi:hypothetical protein K1T71_009085 [Dendrolimus kikuchii]|uniref:Uncharacterized protein n=1 Tax=Dendrolimus kikuchii TaxID=765133 RepID=A0ACC1CTD1_9NEOP|nr:hypothetical protein K1T71_009085 [Dendrolimus kikuchii]
MPTLSALIDTDSMHENDLTSRSEIRLVRTTICRTFCISIRIWYFLTINIPRTEAKKCDVTTHLLFYDLFIRDDTIILYK